MSKNRSSALKRDREVRKNEKRAMKKLRREDRKRGDTPDEAALDPTAVGMFEEELPDALTAHPSPPSDTKDSSSQS